LAQQLAGAVGHENCGLMRRRISQISSVQFPDRNGVRVIVYSREPNLVVSRLYDVKSEGSSLGRVDRELADELAVHREFDNFAWLIWIRIDPVTIANQKMPIRSKHHRQCSMQVNLIGIDKAAGAIGRIHLTGIRDRKDLIVPG
jgi:hypothetical protein